MPSTFPEKYSENFLKKLYTFTLWENEQLFLSLMPFLDLAIDGTENPENSFGSCKSVYLRIHASMDHRWEQEASITSAGKRKFSKSHFLTSSKN